MFLHSTSLFLIDVSYCTPNAATILCTPVCACVQAEFCHPLFFRLKLPWATATCWTVQQVNRHLKPRPKAILPCPSEWRHWELQTWKLLPVFRVNQQVALQVSDWPQIQGQSHQMLLNQLALLRNTIREGKAGRHSSHWQSVTVPFYCKANGEEDYRWETCSPTHRLTLFLHVIYLCNGIAQLLQLYVQLHPLKQIIQVWCNLSSAELNYALKFCIVAGIFRVFQWQLLCWYFHALFRG